jgi:hypothetical protein
MNLFVMMTAAVMCAPIYGPIYATDDLTGHVTVQKAQRIDTCQDAPASLSFTTNRAKAKKALEDGARVWGIALCPEIQLADRYVGYCKRGFFNVSELTRTSSTTYRVEEKAVEVE